MRPHRMRLAVAAVCLLAVAGCGDDSDDKSSSAEPDTTSSAPSSGAPSGAAGPADTPSAAASSEASEPQRPSPAAKTMAGLLAKSLARGSAHVELALVGTKGTAYGDIDFSSEEPAMDITMKEPGQVDAHLIVVDGVAYAQNKTGNGGKFLAADPAVLGIDAYGFDPSSVLDQVKAFKNGRNLGDGHFRFAQDGRTVDFFFGPDKVLRRMVMSGGLPGDSKLEVTWSDWGKPVAIKAPPKTQITSMPTPQAAE